MSQWRGRRERKKESETLKERKREWRRRVRGGIAKGKLFFDVIMQSNDAIYDSMQMGR